MSFRQNLAFLCTAASIVAAGPCAEAALECAAFGGDEADATSVGRLTWSSLLTPLDVGAARQSAFLRDPERERPSQAYRTSSDIPTMRRELATIILEQAGGAPVQDALERLDRVLKTLEGIAATDENFELAVADFEFFQSLRTTAMPAGGWFQLRAFLQDRGAEVGPRFVATLTDVRRRANAIAFRFDSLRASHVVFGRERAMVAFNRFGAAGRELFDAMLDAHVRRSPLAGARTTPRRARESDPATAAAYLEAYADRRAPDLGLVADALRTLLRLRRVPEPDIDYAPLLARVGARALAELHERGDRAVFAEHSLGALLHDALSRRIAVAAALNLVRNAAVDGSARALPGAAAMIFDVGSADGAAIRQFRWALDVVRETTAQIAHGESAETVFLLFIARCVQEARARVGVSAAAVLDDAATATDLYARSELRGSLTERLPLHELAAALRALRNEARAGHSDLALSPSGEDDRYSALMRWLAADRNWYASMAPLFRALILPARR